MFGRKGFTLIEVAIVIVIIGLIIGGIIAGQGAIEEARKTKIIAEINTFNTAYKQFVDKYRQLPGDFPFATTPSGAAAPSAEAPFYTASNATGDGNGDRKVLWDVTGSIDNEGIMAWQQIAMEKLIPGSYAGSLSGVNYKDMANALVGLNVPKSSTTKSGLGYAFDYDVSIGNHIIVGFQKAAGINSAPAFSPEYAYFIDAKADDGLPDSGVIQSRNYDAGRTLNANCTNDLGAAGASPEDTYKRTETGVNCILQYRLDN
jgi:prepilin-type N-terminal cleavage/methylation domain-containing protein